MKLGWLFALLTISPSIFGQGTIEFRSEIISPFGVIPGSFFLSPENAFSGSIWFDDPPDTTVKIYRSSTSASLGEPIFTFNKGLLEVGGSGFPFNQYYDFPDQTLNQSQVNDLLAGYWWVSVITPDFPSGDVRGQVLAVPESSTSILFLTGLCVVVYINSRNRLRIGKRV